MGTEEQTNPSDLSPEIVRSKWGGAGADDLKVSFGFQARSRQWCGLRCRFLLFGSFPEAGGCQIGGARGCLGDGGAGRIPALPDRLIVQAVG
jgi:hypothetical protein